MLYKSELILGDSIRDKTALYDLLQAGKLPFGYYLLVCTPKGTLEMMPYFMRKNRYIVEEESVVFGVAGSKYEANKMICDILTKIYVEKKYCSVEAFVKEILGNEIC